MTRPRFSRYDVPRSVQRVIEAAIENRVIDALGLAETVVELMDLETGKVDPEALVDRLVGYAWCNRHNAGSNPHAAVCKAAEYFWRELVDAR